MEVSVHAGIILLPLCLNGRISTTLSHRQMSHFVSREGGGKTDSRIEHDKRLEDPVA